MDHVTDVQFLARGIMAALCVGLLADFAYRSITQGLGPVAVIECLAAIGVAFAGVLIGRGSDDAE